MTDFWLFAALLVVSGVVAVLWPIWRHHRQERVDRTALNVALYEERVAELDAQRQSGVLSAEQHELALEEASRLLLEDTARADSQQRATRRGNPLWLIVSAGLLPVVVVGLYLVWGNFAGMALHRDLQESPPPENVEALIERMQRVTSVQPESGEAWFMLGRAYMAAQQPGDAARAFGNSLERLGERPEVLAQLAQARFFAAGNTLDNEAVAALDKALELDPREPTALGLLGIAAFEAGDYSGAIGYWQTLLGGMQPGSPGAQAIQGGIDRARQRMGEVAGEPGVELSASGEPSTLESGEEPGIAVRVELSSEIAEELNDQAVVFVFARDPSGPPMPLVARRFTLDQLPADVTLTSSDAMLPEVKLRAGQQVQLIARVSPTGDPMQGSHQGQTEAEVGAEGRVTVTIDQPVR
ncbi:cytochrome c-type biogenesis protein CcmH [Halopseudomonas xinjiangensis]|uniref:Cytochrome c-type biogenesis protein CcmH n=1 Tax=Halopseudomonas xinjiangensis TaxID=487184 RepID=A0A1H1NDL3_9GAMM|nr:c-type cytochrome biogenesis protein CcmI [Halopseudomonas xinjiangensis]SDR97042.1 cytochrome c-type biogenesis protein CcmH [Halopseudomonas xinjiangensis]